jgi:hypothetical protein
LVRPGRVLTGVIGSGAVTVQHARTRIIESYSVSVCGTISAPFAKSMARGKSAMASGLLLYAGQASWGGKRLWRNESIGDDYGNQN